MRWRREKTRRRSWTSSSPTPRRPASPCSRGSSSTSCRRRRARTARAPSESSWTPGSRCERSARRKPPWHRSSWSSRVAKSAETGEGLRGEPFSAAFFFDNPTFGRALRYTFADKRLGRAVFMNALLLVVALGVVQDLFTRGVVGLISEKLSFGRAAFVTVCLVETIAVSMLGPLSFAHIFNAERREDCFDQVVATGCSPLRVLLGRLGAVLVFLAVTVGSSLPFFIFASFVLKGASAGDVLEFFLVLGLYGTCICTMTMATCVAVEDAAFPVVLAGIFSIIAV